MSKHKDSLQTHHLYLGAGGMLAVAALVVALTFGLSSAEHGIPDGHTTTCSTGQHWDTATNSCVPDSCPAGFTGTPPNCTSTCTSPAYWDTASSTCKTPTDPADACRTAGGTYNAANTPPCTMPVTDQWAQARNDCGTRGSNYRWDEMSHTCNLADPQADCTRAGGTYDATKSPSCTMPGSQTCPTGQRWDTAMNSGAGGCRATTTTVQCDWATQYTRMSDNTCQPKVNCTTVGNVDYNTAECQGVRSATGTPPSGGCQAPTSFWNGTACVAPLVTGVTCTANQHKMPGPPEWCMEGTTHTTDGQQDTQWTRTRTECPTSKPISCEANNAFTCTVTQVECDGYRNVDKQPRCPTGEHWESSRNGCVADQTFRTCGPDERPTTDNPCRPSDDRPLPPPDWQPGQCQPDQQQCPDRFDTSRTVCMPKELRWDPKTKTRVDPPRPATCADFQPLEMPTGDRDRFQPPFGRDRGPRVDFSKGRSRGEGGHEGEGREDRPMNPCELNPDDPVCQFGFDFSKYGDQYSFDKGNINVDQYKVRNAMGDIKRLQLESKKWRNDAKQARQQLKEISRESGGFACPAAAEVDALVTELENATNQINALNENSTKEEIQRGLALNDHVYGRPDPVTGEQTVGITGKLYGGPPDPITGVPVPGKTQGLNGCRELSGVIVGACQAYKNISREFENIKENAPAEAVAVFEEVLPELKSRCENPLAVLAEKGISLDVLIEPWYPDPEVCNFGGFPGGPGGFPGPFPGPFPGGPGGFPGGPGGFPGGDFPPMMGGPFGDMPPEMMEMMKEKMKEFESSGRFGGGFPGGGHRGSGDYPDPGFRGRDFQSSVLMPPSHPFNIDDEDDFFDDDDFEGEEGFGPPEECQPPVMRYLGLDKIMRKLDAVRPLMMRHFESMNACKMFEMGKKMSEKMSDRESVRGGRFGVLPPPPPEMQPLMASGLKACEAGDKFGVDKIKEKMMRFGRGRGGLRGAIDVDEVFKDTFKEKIRLLRSEEEEEGQTAALEKKIRDLQNQLDEAQKMIISLKTEVSNLLAKSTVILGDAANEQTARAIATLGDLPNAERSVNKVNTVTGILATAEAAKEAVKEALPPKEEAKAEAAIDAALKSIIFSPPSEQALSNINESLVTIQSYASSGATVKEIVKKAQEEAAAVIVTNTNSAETSNKIAEGICASLDTCDLSDWVSPWALKAADAGLTSPEAQNFVLNPAKATTVAQVVVRAVNLACDNGILKDCPPKSKTADDPAVKAALADAKVPDDTPWWAAVPMHTLVNQNSEAAKVLSELSPTQIATREVVAAIMATALKLPDVPETRIAEVLPDDAEASKYAPYIAECVDAGFMSTTDGVHFTPGQTLSVSQDFVIASNAHEYLKDKLAEGGVE